MPDGIIKGSEINNLEMHETIRITMLELLRGYPAHLYWGIFEGRFDKGIGEEVVKILDEHKLIETKTIQLSNELKNSYRLTPKGIEVAVSLAQLNYADKMDKFTKILILFGGATLFVALEQIILTLIFR